MKKIWKSVLSKREFKVSYLKSNIYLVILQNILIISFSIFS